VTGPGDYRDSAWFNRTRHVDELFVPSSCCLQPATTALDQRPGAGTQYLSPCTVYSRPLRPLTSDLVLGLSLSVLVRSKAGHYDPRPAAWRRVSVSHGVVGASGLPAGRHSTVRAWREAACHCPQDPGILGYHRMYLLGVR